MKTLYIECKMGCAGDMLMGALSELVDQQEFLRKMQESGLHDIQVLAQDSVKCGIHGTHMKVTVNGVEEQSHDVHDNLVNFTFHLHHASKNQQDQLVEMLEKTDGVSNPHFHDDHLHVTFDHDHESELNEIIHHLLHEIDEAIELHADGHSHHEHHETHQHHHGMHMSDIESIISGLHVSSTVKSNALAVYRLILEAESNAHHMEMEHVHFHEVGTMDAIADVVGNCILMEMIGADRILASPVALGNGLVRCAHGILPVPAPATAYLLRDIPTYSGRMNGELCTPTGAALLKHFVQKFDSQPVMRVSQIGYGMGNKDFEVANCVRAFLGETENDGELAELACTIDDQNGEEIGFAIDRLFENGALDVYTTPVQMKKNRPGIVLTVACRNDDIDRILHVMFEHLTTLGIREYHCRRHALQRHFETKHTPYGDIRIKHSTGYGVSREKMEYDDLSRIAREQNMSIQQIKKKIEGKDE